MSFWSILAIGPLGQLPSRESLQFTKLRPDFVLSVGRGRFFFLLCFNSGFQPRLKVVEEMLVGRAPYPNLPHLFSWRWPNCHVFLVKIPHGPTFGLPDVENLRMLWLEMIGKLNKPNELQMNLHHSFAVIVWKYRRIAIAGIQKVKQILCRLISFALSTRHGLWATRQTEQRIGCWLALRLLHRHQTRDALEYMASTPKL